METTDSLKVDQAFAPEIQTTNLLKEIQGNVLGGNRDQNSNNDFEGDEYDPLTPKKPNWASSGSKMIVDTEISNGKQENVSSGQT